MHVEANAVVADENHRFVRVGVASNFNFGRVARAGVFDGVKEKIA
jgi:hypothetical protein